MRASALAASVSLLLGAAPAAAFDWPVARVDALPRDPIERLRWDRISAWHAPSLPDLRLALARLDAAPESARSLGLRAVVLRLQRRDDEARAALRRALSLSPDRAVLDDPDVALTAAWLAARAGDFAEASRLGRSALSRLARPSALSFAHREALSLEVARWAMARGPDGLDDALRVLRAGASTTAASPLVRATLALVLARAGRLDDARAVASLVAATLQNTDITGALPSGATLPDELSAAVGVALLLNGHPREAREALTVAAQGSPEVWRPFQRAQLAAAQRGAP
jgi:tetratricopeptide (TPR) repeat protein